MTQGPTGMMNRSWLLKLFSVLDADLGLEGRFASMGDLYNSWLSAMRPTHWGSDNENVPITAGNQKRLWAMTEVFILSMQMCGVMEVPEDFPVWDAEPDYDGVWAPRQNHCERIQILLTGQQYYKKMFTTGWPTNHRSERGNSFQHITTEFKKKKFSRKK